VFLGPPHEQVAGPACLDKEISHLEVHVPGTCVPFTCGCSNYPCTKVQGENWSGWKITKRDNGGSRSALVGSANECIIRMRTSLWLQLAHCSPAILANAAQRDWRIHQIDNQECLP